MFFSDDYKDVGVRIRSYLSTGKLPTDVHVPVSKDENTQALSYSDYIDAIHIQDACNLSGVVHAYSRLVTKVWQEAHWVNGGTDYVNQHPLVHLYLSKLASLAGSYLEDGNRFREAIHYCWFMVLRYYRQATEQNNESYYRQSQELTYSSKEQRCLQFLQRNRYCAPHWLDDSNPTELQIPTFSTPTRFTPRRWYFVADEDGSMDLQHCDIHFHWLPEKCQCGGSGAVPSGCDDHDTEPCPFHSENSSRVHPLSEGA